MKSGKFNFLEHSGPLQACNGTALPLLDTSRYSASDGHVWLSCQEVSIASPRHNSNNISMYNFMQSGWLKLSTICMDLKYTHIAALSVLATPYTVCAAGIPLRRAELSWISSILQCKVIHNCNTKHLTQYFSLFTNISCLMLNIAGQISLRHHVMSCTKTQTHGQSQLNFYYCK